MRYVFHDTTQFLYGKNDAAKALEASSNCPYFAEDEEDECVSEEKISCFNCRYRRWTRESYVCMKGKAV